MLSFCRKNITSQFMNAYLEACRQIIRKYQFENIKENLLGFETAL